MASMDDFVEQISSTINGISNYNRALVNLTQSDSLLDLQIKKERRIKQIQQRYKSGEKIKKIILSHELGNLNIFKKNYELNVLSKNCLKFNLEESDLNELIALIADSIVIFNNNDVAYGTGAACITRLIKLSPSTIFCCWDWDSHHWLDHSCSLAAVSDFYFSAAADNFYTISRFNAGNSYLLYCGTVQWEKKFLEDNFVKAISSERKVGPLGGHIYYQTFNHRNRIVKTLSDRFSEVKFTTHGYHQISEEKKFKDWMSYKLHFIAPVLNGLPIRFFDALASGGIPLVPTSLKSTIESLNIFDSVFYYTATDVTDFESIVLKAVAKFDEEGSIGVAKRISLGLMHHGSNRVETIIDRVNSIL
jgi:hypothetical protein